MQDIFIDIDVSKFLESHNYNLDKWWLQKSTRSCYFVKTTVIHHLTGLKIDI